MNEPQERSTGEGSPPSGLGTIMLAIVGAGVIGYLIQGLVPLFVRDPAEYLKFSVFWSTLYLVGAGLSGIQQEISRATRTATLDGPTSSIRGLALVIVTAVGTIAVVTAFLWAPPVFGPGAVALTAALIAGVSGYAGMSAMMGLFYGVRLWIGVTALTLLDASLRLVAVVAVLLLGAGTTALGVAVVVPFPLALLIAWAWARRRVGRYRLDVSTAYLFRNMLSTIGGASATGLLTSGFPLLISVTSSEEPAAVGALVFVVTLTRAPLVVPAMALQSYLTVHFRDRVGSQLTPMLRLMAGVVAISSVVALIAYFLEPLLLRALWGEQYSVAGITCALVVLTAGVTAALCISGAAVVAASQHGVFVVGWVAAAVATILTMLLPLALEPRVLLAMAVGPLVGLLVHTLGLLRGEGARSPSR